MEYKNEKIKEFKTNIKMLEQKLVTCNDLIKLNESHKKGKLPTVDFLWKAWHLSQPKGKPP